MNEALMNLDHFFFTIIVECDPDGDRISDVRREIERTERVRGKKMESAIKL